MTEYDRKWSETAQIEEAEKKRLEELAEKLKAAQKAEEQYSNAFDESIDVLTKHQERLKLLKDAQDEYNNAGKLSIATYAKLKDKDLLKYLEQVGNEVYFNAEAFDADSEAARKNSLSLVDNITQQRILQLEAASSADQMYGLATSFGIVTGAAADAQYAIYKFNEALAGREALSPLEYYTGKLKEQAQAQKDTIKNLTFDTYKDTSKKSSGTSSSAKSVYQPTIDVLYAYTNALDTAKDSVDKLNKAISNTKKLDEQEAYIRQIIPALQEQINKTNELRNAQSWQIENAISKLRAYGFQISYNSRTNELYIHNMARLASYTGDTAKEIEKMIKNVQDWNKDNRKLDDSVQDLTANIQDFYQKLTDFPTKKLEKFKEILSDFQQNILEQSEYIKEDLEQQLKTDPRIKALNAQIEALKKQNEQIDKQNDLEEKLLAIEEAKQKLANALTQRNVLLFTEDGWQWVPDIDAVENATEELKEAQDELEKQQRENQIAALEAERDEIEKSYTEQIELLEEFLDERNYQIEVANRNAIQSFDDLTKALQENGIYYQEFIQKSIDWLNAYNAAAMKVNQERLDLWGQRVNAPSNENLIYSSAYKDRIDKALSGFSIDTSGNGITIKDLDYSKLGQNGGQNIYIDNIQLPDVRNVDEFINALRRLPNMATSSATSRR